MKSCRLYGGPFDGDSGEMHEPLPHVLWVYNCGNEDCPVPGKIHWLTERPDEFDTDEYRLGPETGVVRLYVWADLELDPGNAAHAEELVAA